VKVSYSLSPREAKLVAKLLHVYEAHEQPVSLFRDQLVSAVSISAKLNPLIHSIRSRLKAPDSLQDKLTRKLSKCKRDRKLFDITADNLLTKITDLVGVRILHLHTTQIKEIDQVLKEILDENQYQLVEGPFARTWDDESREFFVSCGIETQQSPTMYTSVHYVIGSASRTKIMAELQVRTLMEEVWGEVDHTINYPHPIEDLPSREQLKVLARVTSSASRLVDSIFATAEHYKKAKASEQNGASRSRTSQNRGKRSRRRA
jgi:ppGpp synthetase/RelA/SpoT-type nucleotidyltranferase